MIRRGAREDWRRARGPRRAAPTAAGVVQALILLAIASSRPSILQAGPEISLRAPVSYRIWTLPDTSSTEVSQLLAPAILSLGVSDLLGLVFQGGYQLGALSEGREVDLQGPTDVKAAIVLRPMSGRMLIQAGVNIPTGPGGFDEEERLVASALAPPYLGYRLRQPGRGLDAGLALSLAIPIAEGWTLGLGSGYLYRGRHTPLDDGEEITPGAETSVSTGLDAEVGSSMIRVDVTRRIYARDEGGRFEYEEPSAWEGSLKALARGRRWDGEATALVNVKEDSEVSPSAYAGIYAGGNLSLGRRFAAGLFLGIVGEMVRFRAENPDGDGHRFVSTTGGAGPQIRVGSGRVRIEGSALRMIGDLDGESIEGWDAHLALLLRSGNRDE